MAAKGLSVVPEDFCCSICLDFMKDPVTLPCGHSYCRSCVHTHWNGETVKKSYSCPQCRHRFTHRPVLVTNSMLALLMERLQVTEAPAAPLSHSSAAHGHVCCDLCSGKKVKALKSCLQCLVSYCEEHLQPHYHVAALKKHKLLEPSENFQDNICSQHQELKELFCRSGQRPICYLCSVDQHKGHDIVTAAAERTEKQRELETITKDVLQTIHNKEKEVFSLQCVVKNISVSAHAAVEYSNNSIEELIGLLEKRMSEVQQHIRSQQKAEENKVKELEDQVQQEIRELRRKHSELDTVSQTEDDLQFLHKFASLSEESETSDWSSSSRSPPPFQDMVTAAVAKLKNRLQENCQSHSAAAQVTVQTQQHVPPHPNLKMKQSTYSPQTVQLKDLFSSLPPVVFSSQQNAAEERPTLRRNKPKHHRQRRK